MSNSIENCADFEKPMINAEAYPSELKDYKQWVLWSLKERGERKSAKVPYTTNGGIASPTDPKTWCNFDEAFEVYQGDTGRYSGLGFVLTEGDPFIGFDWDHVRDPISGEFDPGIQEEFTGLNSYAEISQSGEGVHVIAKGTIPGSRNRSGCREMYESGRFFAMTGNHIEGTPCTVTESPEEAIRAIYEMVDPAVDEGLGKVTIPPDSHVSGVPGSLRAGVSDFEILERCRREKNSDRFNILYGGNWDVLGSYPSKSEADLALCSMIAAHTQNAQQIDRIFTGSGLYTEKWGRIDYKEQTIRKAMDRICEDPQRKYFAGNGRFIVKSLADEIMGEHHFLTYEDTKEIYYYENGIYRLGGENLIIKGAQKKLGEYSRKSYRDEVKSYIQYETLISRDSVNNLAHIINLKNGLYDLKEDKFKPHTPKLLSTVQIPVNYDPNAECPRIDKFLSEIVSEEDKPVLLEWIGYSMIPNNRMQKSVMLLGSGSNGKSVFLNLLTDFIGLKNTAGESLEDLEKDKYSTSNLYGKLLNVFPVITSSSIYNSSVFKTLTGNEKKVKGEKKYQPSFYFNNTARLIFSANILPPVKNDGRAFYRRWILIEFPNRFDGKNADENLIDKLTTERELSGLLNKAIMALQGLLERGEFSYHKSIEEIERMYRLKSDTVGTFADECVKMSAKDTLKAVVYDSYVKWCNKNGEKPVSNAMFGKKFKALGYESFKASTADSSGKRGYYWEGITVSSV